ncbi:hypothetical protein NHX12_003259 [Muraenolepis orangiensis]|uniref:Uncharacterized protein n=1 Tax=Muraenolepis orangiensis TaxID=630683 RepID=A0A9Q0IFM7_9TELE|nr:hypothetical protein NHX12_003259 [Muraenolepis orangiensis]
MRRESAVVSDIQRRPPGATRRMPSFASTRSHSSKHKTNVRRCVQQQTRVPARWERKVSAAHAVSSTTISLTSTASTLASLGCDFPPPLNALFVRWLEGDSPPPSPACAVGYFSKPTLEPDLARICHLL